jgi:hypothetical protein
MKVTNTQNKNNVKIISVLYLTPCSLGLLTFKKKMLFPSILKRYEYREAGPANIYRTIGHHFSKDSYIVCAVGGNVQDGSGFEHQDLSDSDVLTIQTRDNIPNKDRRRAPEEKLVRLQDAAV